MQISVYITSYNQNRYLVEAIESVLAQTLLPSQLIIIDDHSGDGSQAIIAGFHSRYPDLVLPIYHQRNTGVTQARIDALRSVTGDYVTYVDGDDRLLPTKLQKEAALLTTTPDAHIAFSNNFYMTSDGVHTGLWAETQKPHQGYVFLQTFTRNFPRRSLFRMELVNYRAWKRIGFHDPNLHIYEDYDMRIRLTRYLRVVYHDEPLSEIRLHGSGLSSASIGKHLDALDYIYRKNESLLGHLAEPQREYAKDWWGRWMGEVALHGAIHSFRERAYRQGGILLVTAMRYDPAALARTSLARAHVPPLLERIASPWRGRLKAIRRQG